MPAIHSASIATKLVQSLGGATLIGPMLLGLGKPVRIAPLSASVSKILNMAMMAAYEGRGICRRRSRGREKVRSAIARQPFQAACAPASTMGELSAYVGAEKMQIVGKFQAVTQGDRSLASESASKIEAWTSSKFEQNSSGYWVVKRTGVEALFDKTEAEFADNHLVTYEVLEPIQGGQLQTICRILSTTEQVHFNCTLSIGTDGGLAPPQIDLHAPRFIREIIGPDGQWQFSQNAENLISRFINVGINDVDQFLNLLQSRLRRLPLIVVSEFEGRAIANDMHVRAAADLCGLGHTCLLTEEAAWEITARIGRDWSQL